MATSPLSAASSSSSGAQANDPSTTLLNASPRVRVQQAQAQVRGAETYNNSLALSSARDTRSSFFLNQLLAICGGCNAADAVEILAVSFILPAAEKDLHLTDPEKGWLAGMIFAGMMIGGWLWGSASDRYGRRPCLIWCLVINGLGGLVSALAPSFNGILVCRFISGIGVGGSVPVVFTYFSEFLSTRDRGPYMVAIACCWMVGSLFTAGLAWLIIPLSITWDLGFLKIHSWRLFAFLCAFPSLACAVSLIGAPESPRWLLARGRTAEAKEVLLRIYSTNWAQEMARTDADLAQERLEQGGMSLDGDRVIQPEPPCAPTWCGTCWTYQPTTRVSAYLEVEASRTHQDVEQVPARPRSPVSATDSTAPLTANTHQGTHGIKYSQLNEALESGADGLRIALPAPAANHESVQDPSPHTESAAVTLAEAEAAAALVEEHYASLDEVERWKQFIAELSRLDTVPVALDDSFEPPLGSETPVSPDARILDGASSASSDGDLSDPRSYQARWRRTLREIRADFLLVLRRTASLFKPELRATSLKLFSTWFFLAFGYYGLTMWMPSYFAATDGDDSDDSGGGMDMYLTAIVGALSALPANVISIFTVRLYGRIRTLVVSLLLSGVCVILVPVLNSPTAAVVMLCVFSGVNTASWNALNISTTELYSTEVRATAFGFFAAMGRIGAVLGNVMFGDLMSASTLTPLFITGAALVVAAVSGALLPETKHLNLS